MATKIKLRQYCLFSSFLMSGVCAAAPMLLSQSYKNAWQKSMMLRSQSTKLILQYKINKVG